MGYLFNKLNVLYKKPIMWVLAGGLLLRIFFAAMRCIINPDGAQYLYQASAIFNRQWSSLLTCKLSYVSPLPIAIAAAFGVCRDWIFAGQAVNILLGWATLIPLYFLLRRFFDQAVATLTLLIYALIPVFVDGSSNITRGPMFWFFLSMGMLLFVRQWDADIQRRRLRLDLFFSGLFFLLATWARIEGVIFLVISPLYLLLAHHDRKPERLFLFLAPLSLIGITMVGAVLFYKADVISLFKVKQVVRECSQFLSQFKALDSELKMTASQQKGLFAEFLRRTRESLVLLPLVSIFHNILEGVFYPYALLYFLGFLGLRTRLKEDRRMGYFLWLCLGGIIVLYVHLLQVWIISYRFLAVLIYPGCLIMANGVQTAIRFFQEKYHWQKTTCVIALSALLLAFGLIKNVKSEEKDKIVYRQAADILAQSKASHQLEPIAGTRPSRVFEWVLLYAHRKLPQLACSKRFIMEVPSDYQRFVQKLDKLDIHFFLYEQRYWPDGTFDLLTSQYQRDFQLLGQWQHPDSVKAVLLQRIDRKKGDS